MLLKFYRQIIPQPQWSNCNASVTDVWLSAALHTCRHPTSKFHF